ncbi:MAG: polyphosphate:AMP phosphotransferase, partial [Planctomycetota bacterium]|nr:polyphosphate:AMP phosphotransferase [Planctomycetota bacterium]
MFEAAELGHTVDKQTYNREVARLRSELLAAQKQLAGADFSVVIIVSGVEGAGKAEIVNLLLEWMDARGIQTHAMWDPSDEERERPPYWRFWRVLPPKGHIGIFFGSWYTAPVIDHVFKRTNAAEFDLALDDIVSLERMLSQENVLVLKFWMHLSKAAQRERLRELEASKKTRWRVTKTDWKFFKKYDAFRDCSEAALRKTNTAHAPWHIVDSADERYRALTVGRALLEALQKRLLQAQAKPRTAPEKPPLPKPEKVNVINRLDMSLKASEDKYKNKLL